MSSKDFFGEMDTSKNPNYDRLFCLIILGLPSSGKTHLARELSKSLNLYLINSDYVRGSYHELLKDIYEKDVFVAKPIVDDTNFKKCVILCDNKIPFIFDGNNWDKELYPELFKILSGYGYERVTVRVKSSRDKCIDNLSGRKEGPTGYDFSIMGDSIFYTPPLIRKIEEQDIPDSNFDYVIDNFGTLEEFDGNIKELIAKISKARGRKQ